MRPTHFHLLRCISFVLLCSLTCESLASAPDVPAPFTAAMARQALEARGIGKMVKVKEADGKVLRAKIVSIGEQSVVLKQGSKPTVEVPYANVTAVTGPGLSSGEKVAIGVGIGVVVVVAIAAIVAAHALDGFGKGL